MPGHTPGSMALLDMDNHILIGGAKEIVDGKATGNKTNSFGNDIMVYDFNYAVFCVIFNNS